MTRLDEAPPELSTHHQPSGTASELPSIARGDPPSTRCSSLGTLTKSAENFPLVMCNVVHHCAALFANETGGVDEGQCPEVRLTLELVVASGLGHSSGNVFLHGKLVDQDSDLWRQLHEWEVLRRVGRVRGGHLGDYTVLALGRRLRYSGWHTRLM
jgi:hypothetical protein